MYEYEESVPYAIDLFCDTRLFGQPLRLQNRTTGAGMPSRHQGCSGNLRSDQSFEYSNNEHQNRKAFSAAHPMQRQHGAPQLQLQQFQAQHMQMHQDFQPWQYNSGIQFLGPMLNMHLNALSTSAPTSSSSTENAVLGNGFIPQFLPPPPGIDMDGAISGEHNGNREFENMQFTINNTNYQEHTNHQNHDRRSGGHHSRNSSNFDRRDDRNRNDRSRSNDRTRSHGYDRYDRRRRY